MGGRGATSFINRGGIVLNGGRREYGKSKKIHSAPFQAINGNKNSKSMTFSKVEKMIASNNYETGLIVDNNGFVLAAYKGTKDSVGFASDISKIKGNIVTHNHPSGNAVFSVADIKVSGKYGAVGVRATTKNNGTAVLRKASNNPNWEQLAKDYNRFGKKLRTPKEAQNWLSKNSGKYGLKFEVEK